MNFFVIPLMWLMPGQGMRLFLRLCFIPFWGAIGAIAGLAGLGLSWYQQQKQDEANEEARRQQRRDDLLSNIISIAGGRGVSGFSTPIEDYQIDYGGLLTKAGDIASEYGRTVEHKEEKQQQQQQYQDKLMLDQITAGYIPPGASQEHRDAVYRRWLNNQPSGNQSLLPGEVSTSGGMSIAPYNATAPLTLEGLAYPQQNAPVYDEFGRPVLRQRPYAVRPW